MIKITLDSTQAVAKIQQIARQLEKPRALYGVLGEALQKTHRQHFDKETSPKGDKWKPLSPITLAEKRGKGILKDRNQLRNGELSPFVVL